MKLLCTPEQSWTRLSRSVSPIKSTGDDFVGALEGLSGGDTTVTIALILAIFGVAHSGLASLRPKVRNRVCLCFVDEYV